MKRSMVARHRKLSWAYGFISILLLGLVLAVSLRALALGRVRLPLRLAALGNRGIADRRALRSWRWVALLLLVEHRWSRSGCSILAVGFLSSAHAPSPIGQGGSRILALALAEPALRAVHYLPSCMPCLQQSACGGASAAKRMTSHRTLSTLVAMRHRR